MGKMGQSGVVRMWKMWTHRDEKLAAQQLCPHPCLLWSFLRHRLTS